MLAQVWHPLRGQVEHDPVSVTPKPVAQTEHVAYPMHVTQLETEHPTHLSEGLIKYPFDESQVKQVKEAELYGRLVA